jgi:hypothetical protein
VAATAMEVIITILVILPVNERGFGIGEGGEVGGGGYVE